MRPEPIPAIRQIEEAVKDVPGWSPLDQLYTLYCLVSLSPDLSGDIVEVGSWCGRSTTAMGLAARIVGNTLLHCIDPFPEKGDWKQNADGSYSFETEIDGRKIAGYREQTVWKEPFEKDIAPVYEKHGDVLCVFRETMERNGLLDLVRPFRGDTEMWKEVVPAGFRCRLAFIDGDHGYEAVCRDIRNIDPFLVDGGWICFDDAFSGYAGVDRAITELVVSNPSYEQGRQMTRKCFVARKRREMVR